MCQEYKAIAISLTYVESRDYDAGVPYEDSLTMADVPDFRQLL